MFVLKKEEWTPVCETKITRIMDSFWLHILSGVDISKL